MAQDAQLISQAGLVESLASDGLVSVSTGAGQPQKNMELAKFADSLGSSVPLQQNAEQVNITGLYARTSDGKMVELTSDSVAKVIAEVFSSYQLQSDVQKFKSSYIFGNGVDVNDVRSNTYVVNAENLPDGSNHGYVEVLWTQASGTIMQRFTAYTDSNNTVSYVRSGNGIFWNAWTREDNFGYNTLAELSSGVAEQMGLNGKFYTATITGTQTNANPTELAKEIINSITADICSFSILHSNQGYRHAYGYIYNGKKSGYITIEQYSGFHVSYNINDGVYTLVTN